MNIAYDRESVVEYAKKWALGRNPEYANFHGMGGDCANFASQCVFAGIGVMNLTRDTGWYYINMRNRAPAWSGVRFLRRFLLENRGTGPFGEVVGLDLIMPGDLIFLGSNAPYHTLVVLEPDGVNTLIAAHSGDSLNRGLYTYNYRDSTAVHVLGGRGGVVRG